MRLEFEQPPSKDLSGTFLRNKIGSTWLEIISGLRKEMLVVFSTIEGGSHDHQLEYMWVTHNLPGASLCLICLHGPQSLRHHTKYHLLSLSCQRWLLILSRTCLSHLVLISTEVTLVVAIGVVSAPYCVPHLFGPSSC